MITRLVLFLAACLAGVPVTAKDQPARPQILHIAFVRLKAADLEKSADFYSRLLGLRGGHAGCHMLSDPCFAVNSYQHIELRQASAPDSGSFLDEIGFATSNLPEMRKYLVAHGQNPTQISRGQNGLRFIELRDPEGNRVAFVEASGADSERDGPRQISNRLFHAGFVVKDRDAQNRFYSDLLGFRLYWYGGFKDDGVDWYEIQVPDGDNWIEYMLNIPANADHQELGIQNHFSLGVRDIKAAALRLRANGLLTKDEPEIGRDGKWSFDIYDPDATRVELMEFSPASKPCCHSYTGPHPQP